MIDRILIGVLLGFVAGALAFKIGNRVVDGIAAVGCAMFVMWSVDSGVLYTWLAIAELGLGFAVAYGVFGKSVKKSE